ncbi:MAG: leucine-rich repeat protein [Clostridia bacterium]|nr:leucine-rich repeat protein [Clostridia bacterium]
MKKKLFLITLMVLLCTMLMTAFAITVSATDGITVRYCWFSESTCATITPNEDGTYTLRDTKLSNDGTVTLADGTTVAKTFYGWFDKEGNLYAPGATVTFTKDTDLFEAYGTEVTTAEDLESVISTWKDSSYIKLGANITTSNDINGSWDTTIIDLSGYRLEITTDKAVDVSRGSFMLVGEGEFVHNPETISTKADATLCSYSYNGYGAGDHPQFFVVGKDVNLTTPYYLVRVDQALNNSPRMHISGTVKAKGIIRAGVTTNATIKIYPSADITFTGTDVFNFTDESGTQLYATITFDGKIKTEDPNASLFKDFLMTNRFEINTITSGEYSVSETDAERLAMFLPETLMLYTQTDEDGTVWYKIKEADCVHEWVFNEEDSISATLTSTGIDVYDCSKCGTSKQSVAIYKPTETEVTITALQNGEKINYTVLAGEVYEFDLDGVGTTALCYIASLKDTADFLASEIVGIEIPAGVSFFEGIANDNIEKITIQDGTDVEISVLDNMSALKEIEVKASTVLFAGIKSKTLEKIISETVGADVTFGGNAFSSLANVSTLKMSTGSTYTFDTNCFQKSGLTEVVFPDDSVINFKGDAAFYGCPNLTYAYFGKNCISDKKICKKPFDCAYALETVVLMDITYIDQYVFCCNGNANSTADHREGKGGYSEPLRVYHHGDTISLNVNAFVNRSVLGVEFYTLSSLASMSNCKYTIYQGLPHRYTIETVEESTCATQGTAAYVTNCPCGTDYRTSTYTVIDSATSTTTENEALGTELISLPLSTEHVMGTDIADVIYANYFENGTIYYYCSVCNTAKIAEQEPSAAPIFSAAGYSCFEENSAGGISYTIRVNHDALEFFETNKGIELVYGLVVGAHNDGSPVVDKDTVADGVLMADMTKTEYTKLQSKLIGIDSENETTALNMCAYVILDNKVSYLSDTQTYDSAQPITLQGIKELADSQLEATVPSKE